MLPLVLAMSLLAPTRGCPNLSGKYVHAGEDNGVYVSITQSQCERIVMTWAWDTSTLHVPVGLVLDGRFHPTNPRGFLGFREMSASLSGPTLKIVMTGQAPGDAANPYTLRLTLLADGDLCVTDGTPIVAIAASRGRAQVARTTRCFVPPKIARCRKHVRHSSSDSNDSANG